MNVVSYQVSIHDIASHQIKITLQFTPKHDVHILSMAAWIPGSYMIRDFAKHISAISVCDQSGALPLQQTDKQSWQLSCRKQPVTVTYLIYAYDMSVRSAYVDDELAVLNPAALCLAVNDLTTLPHQLILVKPTEAQAIDWRVATALKPIKDTLKLSFGTYQADNFASLIDSPVLTGIFNLQQFKIDGIEHNLVVTGDNLADLPRFVNDLQRVCQQQLDVFGSLPADLDQYWFLLWVTEQGYGGLEHEFSTLLLCNRYDLPGKNLPEPDDNYQQLLALCSHEYFHTWWVKRLKPKEFKPYQLNEEQYSSQLWLYEGFTSYFDDLALAQSGIISTQTYLRTFEKMISRVNRSPSEGIQSLAESSFNAWSKFYKQDENAINAVVSYYAKGALLALCLDANLRAAGSSLQNICRYMYQHYLAAGTDEQSLFDSLTALGFTTLAETAKNWVSERQALPLADALAKLGVALNFRAGLSHTDLNGQSKVKENGALPATLAAGTKVQQGLITITQIINGGPAHQGGLMVGDQLLALAGRKITEHSLPQLLHRLPLGSVQALVVFRKDRLLTLQLPVKTAAATIAELTFCDNKKASDWLQQPVTNLAATTEDQVVPVTN